MSSFCGYYPNFVEISTLRGYYPHFVNISIFLGYYTHFVDTIRIFYIASYIYCHVGHVIHSLVLVVDTIFGHIMSFLACNVRPISYFTYLVKVTGASLPFLSVT